MIEKCCKFLTSRIRKQMPEIDDEKAEVIMYGIELIVGEIPKLILMLIISAILGVFWQTLIAFFIILPYKFVSGGVHLNTHIGCFIMTNLVYCGNAFISSSFELNENLRLLLIAFNILFGIVMITKYAPADTINVPILRKKERRTKKVLSYFILIINMIIAYFIPIKYISNILIYGTLIQSCSITRLAYKLAKNEYGYETYIKNGRKLELA